jgi:hypothetical protein
MSTYSAQPDLLTSGKLVMLTSLSANIGWAYHLCDEHVGDLIQEVVEYQWSHAQWLKARDDGI